jgi:hypothetical protein
MPKFDPLSLLTDEEWTKYSRWNSPRFVGLREPHPDMGLRKEELKLKELDSMTQGEKRQAITRRANYYLQCNYGPGVLGTNGLRAWCKASQEGPFSDDGEGPALELDIE